jgi:hypothetical protein
MGARPILTLEHVAELAEVLPEVTVGEHRGNRTWLVGRKHFAWERPFSKADLRRFGDQPVPQGPIIALSVADLADKEAVLAAGHDGVFTISHFDGYAAVLVQLDAVDAAVFGELLEDAWLAVAPAALARSWLDEQPR